MGALVIAILAAALVLMVVLYPLMRRRSGAPPSIPARPSHIRELLDRRDTILAAMEELETDHGLGNIGDEQYRALRDEYERRAAAVLRALDARASGLSEEIEAEVAAWRAQRSEERPSADGRTAQEAAASREVRGEWAP